MGGPCLSCGRKEGRQEMAAKFAEQDVAEDRKEGPGFGTERERRLPLGCVSPGDLGATWAEQNKLIMVCSQARLRNPHLNFWRGLQSHTALEFAGQNENSFLLNLPHFPLWVCFKFL